MPTINQFRLGQLVLVLWCAFVLAGPARAAEGPVKLGIDRLVASEFQALHGLRIGLITNHTGLDSRGKATADLLAESDQVELVRLFGPEHGIRGELDQAMIEDGVDGPTGLPVVSLYGPRRQPEPEHLEGLDALVFDIQDIGCRFYTYISTMKLAMEAAEQAGLKFIVLDRPNPLGGVAVEGPMLDVGSESFVGCHDLPVRHGMTVGELAKLFAKEGVAKHGEASDVELIVIPCTGWTRSMTWEATDLAWTDPSPNMRRLTQAIVYPGVGLLETTNFSVGRGTDTPFERFGAPWIDSVSFTAELNRQAKASNLPVRFVPRTFTPTSSKFEGELCGGADLILLDPWQLNSVDAGLLIAATLHKLYPEAWETKRYPRLLINDAVQKALVAGATPAELSHTARQGLEAYKSRRAAVLMYE